MMKKRDLLGLMALTPLVGLGGCGGGNDAKVRLINASSGYTSLDLYAGDSQVVSAQGFATASGYKGVSEGTVTFSLRNAGGSTSLKSLDQAVTANDQYTVLAYGTSGALKLLMGQDNVSADSNGKTKVRMLNAASDVGSLDVYLTAQDDSLEGSVPAQAALTGDTPSDYVVTTPGSYRLRVTAAGDTTDLRLDVSDVVLAGKGVVTLVFSEGTGGVLVHGLQIAQGGAFTPLLNTQARVRAVAAMPNSAALSLSVGGSALLSGAPSPRIGSYTLVDAGTVAVTGSVNGAAQAFGSQSLVGGSDVTMMVYGSGTTPLLAVLTDDNRPPSITTKLKVRLVNGMSGMEGRPVSLVSNFSPVPGVTDVAEGTASGYALMDPISSSVLTVNFGADVLCSPPVIDLVASQVYTAFVFGTAVQAACALPADN